ncbi:MAG TPA: gamma-glutamyltransferase [Acidimicrobiia bacterium]|nr:gamma-glutamyltransferase [Acidimicrobiia bacterium]
MTQMALAAPSRIAVSAGEAVVGMGGTAADAAVVMALVAMCTEPGVCAPGAGGFVTVDAGDGSPVVVDGYMAVPGLGFTGDVLSESMTMEYGGGVTTLVGPGTIGVPGSFAALAVASERYGHMPWSELMGLVADTVEPGFPLSQACRTYLVDSGPLIFSQDPASRAALYDGHRLKETGEPVSFVDLPATLRQIGEEGADTFYRGDLAGRIVADLSSRGSQITARDLDEYQPIIREPLRTEIAGWQVVANPPPAVGGVVVLDALRAVAGDAEPLSHAVWRDALVAALTHRRQFEDTLGSDVESLLAAAGLKSPSTVTVSAVDNDGIAVAATFSAGYGSGIVPKGTGLLMNNSVGEIELLPGGVDALVPGERMMSNMAPTTVRSGDDVIAIGSPGADRISSALVITLIRFLLGGDTLEAAVEHPRLHPERIQPVAVAAEAGIDLAGPEVRWYDEPHMFFGGVNSAGRVDGRLVAWADSRRVGATAVA